MYQKLLISSFNYAGLIYDRLIDCLPQKRRSAVVTPFVMAFLVVVAMLWQTTVMAQYGKLFKGSQVQLGYYVSTDGYLYKWSGIYPTLFDHATNWASVSAGVNYVVAIKTDGTLWAWGANTNGQLGDGTKIDKSNPVQIGTETNWASVACGQSHTLAIKTDGTLWAWGFNLFGQLGDGSIVTKTSPVQIGTDNHWSSISAGDYFSLAIKTDGTLWSMGYNNKGQLGLGNTISTRAPFKIGTSSNWATVSAGSGFAAAIMTDGTLWVWGNNVNYELGDGTVVNKPSPMQIGSNDWATVSCGYNHVLGIKTDGTLWAWGGNYYYQLGNNNTSPGYSPEKIGSSSNWVTVTASKYQSCAIQTNGAILTWGQRGNNGRFQNQDNFPGILDLNSPEFNSITSSITMCKNAGAQSIDNFLSFTDIDTVPSQTETFTVSTAPLHGSISVGSNSLASGTNMQPTGWNYTPAAGFSGVDNFVITVDDGNNRTSLATFNVTVNASVASVYDTISSSLLPYTWHGTAYNSGGTYTFDTLNARGCDSTVTLNLTITAAQNNALNFDGTTYVNCGNQSSVNLTSGTLECYVNTSNAGAGFTGIVVKPGAYGLFANSNIITLYDWGSGGVFSATANIADSHWHHIALTFNSGVTNGTNVYVDGNLVLNTTMTVSDQTNPLLIGAGSAGVQLYTGNIDEVSVWNTIRTQSEILQDANTKLQGTESGLVAYYNFNQGTAGGNNTGLTTLFDKTSNANNGTLNGFALNGNSSNWVASVVPCAPTATTLNVAACGSYTWHGTTYTNSGIYNFDTANAAGCDSLITLNLTLNQPTTSATTVQALGSYTWHGSTYTQSGTYTFDSLNVAGCDSLVTLNLTIIPTAQNNVLNFDGTAYVDCGNPSSLQLQNGSLAFYIKSGSYTSDYSGLVVKPNAYGLYLYRGSLVFYNWVTNFTTFVYNNIADNKWHHVAYTFNSGVNNGTNIYVDGILKYTTTFDITDQSVNLFIGAGGAGAQLYSGNIDGVSIWNMVLTQTQIQSDILKDFTGKETGLVSYYNFDEGIAGGDNTGFTTLFDQTINTNNGTLNSFILNGNTSNWVMSDLVCIPKFSTLSESACDSYTWNGITYTQSGKYTFKTLSVNGCDSTAVLALTIKAYPQKPIIKAEGTTSLCDAGIVTLHAVDSIHYKTAQYVSNIVGYSSQYSDIKYSASQLIGQPDVYPVYDDNIAAWAPYYDGNREYLELGFANAKSINYIDVYQTYTAGGIDTIYVKNPNTGLFETVYTNTASEVDSAQILHVTFPTTAFNVSEIRIAINGTVLSDYAEIDAVAIGNMDSLVIPSFTWSPSGSNSNSLTTFKPGKYIVTATMNGCTSVSDTTLIKQNFSTSSVISISACNSYTWNGKNYTHSGTYNDTLVNSTGCDSIASLNLSINQPSTAILNVTAPNSYFWHGTTYTQTGTYTFDTLNKAGCDSITTLNVTIISNVAQNNALNFTGTNYVNCGNQASVNLTSGTLECYVNTSNAGAGFTGLIVKTGAFGLFANSNVITLYDWGSGAVLSTGVNIADNQWHHVALSFNSGVANGTKVYVDGKLVLTTTITVAIQSLPLLIGAGSTGGQAYSGNIDEVSIWNTIRTQADILSDMQSILSGTEIGIVSYYNFNQGIAGGNNAGLSTLLDKTSHSINGTLLGFILNGNTSNWVTSNLHCSPNTATLNVLACGSYTWHGTTYNTSGSYTFDTLNVGGCDSLTTLNLTIKQPTTSSTTQTAVGSYLWNGTVYNASGTYTVHLTNAVGCDSAATLVITIMPATNSWTGNVSTDWFNAGNWTVGVPTSSTDAVIPVTVNKPVISNGTAYANNINIAKGASLTNNTNLDIYGNFADSGVCINGNNSIVILKGSGTVSGITTFRNLEIQGTYTVGSTFADKISVTGILKTTSGTLNTSDKLTLVSNASGTALIQENGGSLLGKAYVQHFTSGANGYHHFSSPVNGATVSSWSNSFPITGANNATSWVQSKVGTLQTYNEVANTTSLLDSGYYNYTSLSGALTPGKGFTAWLNSLPTLNTFGTPNSGTINIPVTHTVGTNDPRGWNFVGNPYPSPISWTALKSINPGLFGDASCYLWKSTGGKNGVWQEFNGTVGVNGAGDIINSSQGFFVYVNASGVLTFNNSVRNYTYLSPVIFGANAVANHIRVSVNDAMSGESDEVVTYTNSYAASFSKKMAQPIEATNPTIAFDVKGTKAAINVLKDVEVNSELPLIISTPVAGNYTLKIAANNTTLPVYLKDAFNGTLTDVKLTGEVLITTTATETANRFSLVFKAPTQELNAAYNVFTKANNIVVTNPATTGATIVVYNTLGQQVASVIMTSTTTSIPVNSTSSHYVVKILDNKGAIVVKQVIIK